MASVSVFAAACWERLRGGGGDAERADREVFTLSLTLLALQHEIGLLSGASTPVADIGRTTARDADDPAPMEEDTDGEPLSFADAKSDTWLSPPPAGHGFRRMRSRFVSDDECAALRSCLTLASVGAFRRGGQTTLSLVPELRERLAACGHGATYELLLAVAERIRAAATEDAATCTDLPRGDACPVCGLSSTRSGPAASRPLHHRGTLLIRLLPPESADDDAPCCWGLEPHQPYFAAHVDKHNAPSYDVSAVLYLSTQGEHFEGGYFAFHDDDADVMVRPTQGGLLTFTSGAENPHSAGRVSGGARFALASWFTYDEEQRVDLTPPLSADAAARVPPLALWTAERALASAAACCLSQNDPVREEFGGSHERGVPLAQALRELLSAGGHSAGLRSVPGGWLASQVGDGPTRQRMLLESAAADGGHCVAESVATSAVSPHGQLTALRAAVRAKAATLKGLVSRQQPGEPHAARAAPAGSGFDLFD